MVSKMSIAGRMGHSSFGRSVTDENGTSVKHHTPYSIPDTLPYVIGVVGSRKFNDKNYFAAVLDKICILHMCENIVFATIDSPGTGELIQEYTDANSLRLQQFPGDQIATECDECIVFWDGVHRESKTVLEYCQEYGKSVKLIDLTDR